MLLNPGTALLAILFFFSAIQLALTANAPSQVTGVFLSKAVRQGRAALIVTWTAPQSDVNITQYQVQYRKNGTFPSSQITISGSPPATSTTLTELDAGTEYNVIVRARANSTGTWSVEQTERTFATPSRVSGVSLTRTVESGIPALSVNWTTPQSDVNISQYQVQYRRSGTTSWSSANPLSGSPPATSISLTGLDAGTEYNIRVRAVSELGAGMWSVEQTERTFDTPSRVTDVSLTKTVENGTSALRVSWASPQSNVNISQYQVQYRSGTNSWNSATTILVSPPATSTILIGLDAGTEYTVRVRAESYDRAGNWSVEQKERTFSDGERLCYIYRNCTQQNTTAQVSTAVVAVIASVLGVILLVLLIVCTVALVVCLKRKQGRMKREIIGDDACAQVSEGNTAPTIVEFQESPNRFEMATRRTSTDSLPEAQRSSDGYDYTTTIMQQSPCGQEEGLYWEPASTLHGIKAQMTQKTNHSLEVQPAGITLLEELGEGEFGMVHKAEWASSPHGRIQVAVKSLHKQEKESKYKLLKEAAIMGQFNHPNVVRLYGVIDTPSKVMLIMEYISRGDLLSHLIECRTIPVHEEELPLQLLTFCQEIAGAMEYLSKKGFIHRDLAARNILLNEEYAAKIADFGMSHNMEEDYYYKAKGGMIPVKWTAPEAVLYRKYSTKSDVWSYGMVMYEIWSLGHKPYEDFDINQVLRALEVGYCQPPPPGCPRNIYKLMVECWNPESHSRPTFEVLTRELARDPETLLSWSEQDKAASSKAVDLGAALEEGKPLYQELQQKYK